MSNYNSKEEGYNAVVSKSSALSILIELGKRERARAEVPDLQRELSLTEVELKKDIDLLEKSVKYIQQNPSKDDNKPFLKRKYMLTLKGMLFLKNLKRKFPEYAESLNFSF